MNSKIQELNELATLATAPARDFKLWHAGTGLNTVTFSGPGSRVQLLSYKVPKGYSLVLTEVQSWVSNPLTGGSPGNPPPAEEVLNWASLFGFFSIDDDLITDRQVPYFTLCKNGLLLVFPQTQCARFTLESANTINPAQFSMSFIFSGFLTLPEHAARLQAMQSVAINVRELGCP